MQQVRRLQARRLEIRELNVFPGPSPGTGGRRSGDCRRGNRGLRGALRGRRRQGGRPSRAQATRPCRLARVPDRRRLQKPVIVLIDKRPYPRHRLR